MPAKAKERRRDGSTPGSLGACQPLFAEMCSPSAVVDKNRLGQNFGRQAGQYDRYAVVQRRLARALVTMLAAGGQRFNRILEIGCGTGYLTALLRQALPQAHLTALDLAPAAVEIARTRLVGDPGIDWLVADGEQEISGHYDLITSSAVLQWFSRPAQACQRYYQYLRPGGLLAFATLGPRTFKELAQSFAKAGRLLPEVSVPVIPARHFADGQSWRDYLLEAGFQDVTLWQELWPTTYPDLWNFLQAVRGMGATSTRPSFLSRRLLAAMAQEYNRSFSLEGAIVVTYEVLMLSGRKPEKTGSR